MTELFYATHCITQSADHFLAIRKVENGYRRYVLYSCAIDQVVKSWFMTTPRSSINLFAVAADVSLGTTVFLLCGLPTGDYLYHGTLASSELGCDLKDYVYSHLC
ncbi:hypothetical protein K503DRAFT_562805 [Rhizopogon vinicolor AM-OR11-026]|uniref:Uncharacterized protein n=1 Tax=Rhizopogon vinicolor AM-OR11-026 TaxID=1314800 RepID=A0A1B7MK45_9AGAM|nr:hypothetical protein K503DRAFT_562805 [Rhizopogon vinicolor AM-OR11-026]